MHSPNLWRVTVSLVLVIIFYKRISGGVGCFLATLILLLRGPTTRFNLLGK